MALGLNTYTARGWGGGMTHDPWGVLVAFSFFEKAIMAKKLKNDSLKTKLGKHVWMMPKSCPDHSQTAGFWQGDVLRGGGISWGVYHSLGDWCDWFY